MTFTCVLYSFVPVFTSIIFTCRIDTQRYSENDEDAGFGTGSRQPSFVSQRQHDQNYQREPAQYGGYNTSHPYSSSDLPQRYENGYNQTSLSQTAGRDVQPHSNYPEQYSPHVPYQPNEQVRYPQNRQDVYNQGQEYPEYRQTDGYPYNQDQERWPENRQDSYKSDLSSVRPNPNQQSISELYPDNSKRYDEQLTIDTNPDGTVRSWNSPQDIDGSKTWKSLDRNYEPKQTQSDPQYLPKQNDVNHNYRNYQSMYGQDVKDHRYQDSGYSSQSTQSRHPSYPVHSQHEDLKAKSLPYQRKQDSFKISSNMMYEDTSLPRGDTQQNRLPVPASYREEYVRQVADAHTPHTKNDMLTAVQINNQRVHEPLFFQFPEGNNTSMENKPSSGPDIACQLGRQVCPNHKLLCTGIFLQVLYLELCLELLAIDLET